MVSLNYDLHLHSCLSPCGDGDMTPANIAGMASLNGLEVVALTDHNTARNCPAFLKWTEHYGLIGIPGMELCTAEEVHVLCLFPTLEDALAFDRYVYQHLLPVENKPELFGRQLLMDEEDQVVGEEPLLLISATSIPFGQVYDLTAQYHGIMIPAHLDKSSTSLLSNLGFIPPDSRFTCAELKEMSNLHRLRAANPYLAGCSIVSSSDAHYLEQINQANYTIQAAGRTVPDILAALTRAPQLSR